MYGALQVIPASSGFCLGSTNWVINSDHEKIVYLSGSSTLTTHPRPMDHHALKNADVLIMTDLTQVPVSNPDSVLGMLCMVVCKFFLCIFTVLFKILIPLYSENFNWWW